jgi:hypothetical protein
MLTYCIQPSASALTRLHARCRVVCMLNNHLLVISRELALFGGGLQSRFQVVAVPSTTELEETALCCVTGTVPGKTLELSEGFSFLR